MKRIVFLFLFLLSAQLSFAETFKPEILNDKNLIGDEITLKISLPPSQKLSAKFKTEFKDAVIRAVEASPEGDAILLKIVAFVSGEIEIPEIELARNGAVDRLEPFKITVLSRTEENDMELRGLKETVQIRERDFLLLYMLISVLVAAILIYFGIKLGKKLKNKREEVAPLPAPVEVARKFIADAKQKRAEGDLELFTDLTTLGLKTYISLKSKKNYREMTTFEVNRALKKDALFANQGGSVLTILRLGDRYKFADELLSEADFDLLIDGFSQFVDKNEPQSNAKPISQNGVDDKDKNEVSK